MKTSVLRNQVSTVPDWNDMIVSCNDQILELRKWMEECRKNRKINPAFYDERIKFYQKEIKFNLKFISQMNSIINVAGFAEKKYQNIW